MSFYSIYLYILYTVDLVEDDEDGETTVPVNVDITPSVVVDKTTAAEKSGEVDLLPPAGAQIGTDDDLLFESGGPLSEADNSSEVQPPSPPPGVLPPTDAPLPSKSLPYSPLYSPLFSPLYLSLKFDIMRSCDSMI